MRSGPGGMPMQRWHMNLGLAPEAHARAVEIADAYAGALRLEGV